MIIMNKKEMKNVMACRIGGTRTDDSASHQDHHMEKRTHDISILLPYLFTPCHAFVLDMFYLWIFVLSLARS